MKYNCWLALLSSVVVGACTTEAPDAFSESASAVTASNRIALNRIALNRIAVNRIALNRIALNRIALNGVSTLSGDDVALLDTENGREIYAYMIQCALPDGQTVSATATDGTAYTFTGAVGLAPAWATQAPTVSERRWVSACLMARSNHFGVSVQLSMRGAHPALTVDADEAATYTVQEGTFYGDLFAEEATLHACSALATADYSTGGLAERRVCSQSLDGVATQCDFDYTGACATACVGDTCSSADGAFSETIHVYLRPATN